MNVTARSANNASLNALDATFAINTVVKLIGRFNGNVFQQDLLIILNIDLYIMLMPFQNKFVCESVARIANSA